MAALTQQCPISLSLSGGDAAVMALVGQINDD